MSERAGGWGIPWIHCCGGRGARGPLACVSRPFGVVMSSIFQFIHTLIRLLSSTPNEIRFATIATYLPFCLCGLQACCAGGEGPCAPNKSRIAHLQAPAALSPYRGSVSVACCVLIDCCRCCCFCCRRPVVFVYPSHFLVNHVAIVIVTLAFPLSAPTTLRWRC